MMDLEEILADKDLLASLAQEYDSLKSSGRSVNYAAWIKARLHGETAQASDEQADAARRRVENSQTSVSRLRSANLLSQSAQRRGMGSTYKPVFTDRPAYEPAAHKYSEAGGEPTRRRPEVRPRVFQAPESRSARTARPDDVASPYTAAPAPGDMHFSRPGHLPTLDSGTSCAASCHIVSAQPNGPTHECCSHTAHNGVQGCARASVTTSGRGKFAPHDVRVTMDDRCRQTDDLCTNTLCRTAEANGAYCAVHVGAGLAPKISFPSSSF